MNAAVETANLTKIYKHRWRPSTPALAEVSLAVREGTIFGLLGPNGAGKTTLVKILLNLAAPTSGRAHVLGSSPGDARIRRRIGYLPEQMRLPDYLRAPAFLRYMGLLNGVAPEEIDRRIPELLELVGLAADSKRLSEYSKGMQQRLGLAQALINDPELLFLDEPTEGLDPLGRKQVRDLLVRLRGEGKTVFLNSHLLSEIELVCDHVLILNRGQVAREGSPAELTRRKGEYRIRLVSANAAARAAVASISAEPRWEGDSVYVAIESGTELNQLIDRLRAARVEIAGIEAVHATLEECFISAVSGQADAGTPGATAPDDEDRAGQRSAGPTPAARAPLPALRPAPAPPPPAPGRQPESSAPPHAPGGRFIRLLRAHPLAAGLVAVLVLAGAWLASRPSASAQGPAESERLYTLTRRDMVTVLRVHGVTEAINAEAIIAPRLSGEGRGSMTITKLALSGTRVKTGDLLVEFDRQNQERTLLDRKADLLEREAQLKKRRAEIDAAYVRDQRELTEAEHNLERAQLDMRRNEVISRVDAEKNRQNLEEAQARLAQVKKTVRMRRTSTQAELRSLTIQRDRARSALAHAQSNADRMQIRAPRDGVVVLNVSYRGSGIRELQEGDDARAGMSLMQVVDPAAMRVRVRVNQADLGLLKPGQPATVRLDAYPDSSLPGELLQVAPMAVTSSQSEKLRTFAATFSIAGRDPRLMPDLSAAVDIELAREPNVLVAPRDTLWIESGKTRVRLKRGGSFETRTVETGATSDSEVVLRSGVEAGAVLLRGGHPTEVALQAPKTAAPAPATPGASGS